ncbi:uncharacterized protein K02A2.6-like [Olea europaea var. sylvestris]|uniref:uncharacterized protein K02A2.6-like n=1 Tax=Olea europaea var. sylvestris TaxID=158386 RepID=UPI000C1D45E0|nr:uncharacterized protein K02A2.6-like [Olea europaea var. sylvestris]
MGVDGLDRIVYIKIITEPSISQILDIMDIDNKPSWMDPIIEFITSGNLPSDARFGIPKVLITDNGRQFDNQQFINFCSNLGIDHRLTSVSHPQSNGLAEVTNRIILQDLRTRISDARGSWSDELPSILWTYRTTHRTTTGETPFMLAYGFEVMVPVEIRLPSHRRLVPETSEHTIEHLDLLEEVREQAAIKVASYQTKTAKHFNSKVKARRFRAGDLVLRRAEAAGHPRKARAHLGRALRGHTTGSQRSIQPKRHFGQTSSEALECRQSKNILQVLEVFHYSRRRVI